MPIASKTIALRILMGAKARWADVPDKPWWLENDKTLGDWFEAYEAVDGECLALPCLNDGTISPQPVAWIMRFYDKANFDVRAISIGAPGSRLKNTLLLKTLGDDCVHWSTKFTKIKKAEQQQRGNAVMHGQRLYASLGGNVWALARCTRGYPDPIEAVLSPDQEIPVRLDMVSPVWMALQDRDEGFDRLWSDGETRFNHYFAGLAKLRAAQLRVSPGVVRASDKRLGRKPRVRDI